jgi:hypothetical protein
MALSHKGLFTFCNQQITVEVGVITNGESGKLISDRTVKEILHFVFILSSV